MYIKSLHINLSQLGIVKLAGPGDADFWCKRRSYGDDTPKGQCLCNREGEAILVTIQFCNRQCSSAPNQ